MNLSKSPRSQLISNFSSRISSLLLLFLSFFTSFSLLLVFLTSFSIHFSYFHYSSIVLSLFSSHLLPLLPLFFFYIVSSFYFSRFIINHFFICLCDIIKNPVFFALKRPVIQIYAY